MTFTYTQNTPNANDTIAKTQPIIKANFNYMRTWGLMDHRFSASTSDVLTGAHNKVTFPANMAAPGIGTAVSVLYPSSGTGTAGIALQNALGSFDITGRNPSVPASPGEIETCLPGKVLLKTGMYTVSMDPTTGLGSGTVTFATPFPTDCRSVQVTPIGPVGLGGVTRFCMSVSTLLPGSFGFSWVNPVSGSATFTGFYWTAIGTAL